MFGGREWLVMIYGLPAGGLALACLLAAATRRWWTGPAVAALILLGASLRDELLLVFLGYGSLPVWPAAFVMWRWGRDPVTGRLTDRARHAALGTSGISLAVLFVSWLLSVR